MSVHDFRWRGEILFGDFQHRFDLRFDSRFACHLVGGVQQVGYLVDVRGDEACQYALSIAFGQLDGGVQVRQLLFKL
ncbi:hypothetical protein D9M71_715150 [compost metagenome]